MKIEWTFEKDLMSQRAFSHEIPVVRLAEVDTLLKEAVWAMELVWEQAPMFSEHTANEMTKRSSDFLASPAVAAWREREEGK